MVHTNKHVMWTNAYESGNLLQKQICHFAVFREAIANLVPLARDFPTSNPSSMNIYIWESTIMIYFGLAHQATHFLLCLPASYLVPCSDLIPMLYILFLWWRKAASWFKTTRSIYAHDMKKDWMNFATDFEWSVQPQLELVSTQFKKWSETRTIYDWFYSSGTLIYLHI